MCCTRMGFRSREGGREGGAVNGPMGSMAHVLHQDGVQREGGEGGREGGREGESLKSEGI